MNTLTINDFQPGDVLIITGRTNRGETRNEVSVTCVNWKGNGEVTYEPMPGSGSGSGSFDPAKVGTKPFGFVVAVEKTGRKVTPWRPWSPRPGDRSYDLMC